MQQVISKNSFENLMTIFSKAKKNAKSLKHLFSGIHSMKALTERFQTPRRLHEKCSAAHLPQNGLMTVHHLPMT